MKQNKILGTKEKNVRLVVNDKLVGDEIYKDMYIVFKNGFKIRIAPKFDLTSKQWGKLMYSIEEDDEEEEE